MRPVSYLLPYATPAASQKGQKAVAVYYTLCQFYHTW